MLHHNKCRQQLVLNGGLRGAGGRIHGPEVHVVITAYLSLQERLWKRVAAKQMAHDAAVARRAKTLRHVDPPVERCGDELGKVCQGSRSRENVMFCAACP